MQVADAIAEATNARLTLIMIVPPGAAKERIEHAREYLGELQDLTENEALLEVIEGEDATAEIVRASRDHDLVVIGASRAPTYRRYLFGRVPDLVARYAECSVLMIKDPQTPTPWTHKVVEFFTGER